MLKRNSQEKRGIPELDIDELKNTAKLLRSYTILSICSAGSGHTGGSMSIADIASALYFKVIKHDPSNPDWEDRDRVYWSVGHKAPVLYAALGLAGYFNIDDVINLRKLNAPFEGHPSRLKLPGIEASSGSLGQGLGIAVGSAIAAKLKGKEYKVYCILGDGELNEGSVWEAAMSASHYNLDNLIAIVDRNRLQIDGFTKDVMKLEPLIDKWTSFGWQVFECDGHDMEDVLYCFDKAKLMRKKPSVIIAHTVKGKCVFFAENVCSYHGIAPKDGLTGNHSLEVALKDIGCVSLSKDKIEELLQKSNKYQEKVTEEINRLVPNYSTNYFWNSQDFMKVEMASNRKGFGEGIEEAGKDKRVLALGADISESIRISAFYEKHPERKSRFFSMGIAEQNMTTVAAGLAKEGYIPFIGSYGVFITGRNWDQLRTTVCYNNYNVKIVDAHGGISVGPDGATHQTLEDITNLYYLPNMKITVPVDCIEAKKATLAIKDIKGPSSIRIAREATPVVTKNKTPYKFGTANIIRYRGIKDKFIDAFDTYLSSGYRSENENLTIIACGPILAEAMRAAYILNEEYNLETRVINMHTVKPIDKRALISAAKDTKIIITCEEHQVGGLGNIVSGIISSTKDINDPLIINMIGVEDRFGQSGNPWELMKLFGLTGEFIVKRAKEILHGLKKI